jgi:hypothetical protein
MRPRRPSGYARRTPPPEFQAPPRPYAHAGVSARAKDGTSRPHVVAVVIVIVIVVIVVLVLVWWFAKRGVALRQHRQAHTSSLIPPPQRDPITGKVLIAQNGACTQDGDCRPGLQCFDAKCRTPQTVAIAKQRLADAARTRGRQQAEAEAARPKQPPQPTLTKQEAPLRTCADCVVTDPQHEVAEQRLTMQEAAEAGIRASLCHTSAVAEADQDFSY